jgi:hypothetical protein
MITQPGHASWRFAETGSRGAVLRRSEGTRFSSRSDDKVGRHKSAIGARECSAADLQGADERIRCSADSSTQSFRRSDEDSGSPANIAASTASHQTQRVQRAEQSDTDRAAPC